MTLAKYEILLDADKMAKVVQVDDFIALEEGKVKGIKNVCSHFLWQDGRQIPREKALKVLGQLTLEELGKLGNEFMKAAEVAAGADPKAPEESTAPTSPD